MEYPLYTPEEIEEDIWKFETVKIKLGNVEQFFLKKYSHYYKDPLSGECTVDDFKARFLKYRTDCMIFMFDKPPDDDFSYSVYIYDQETYISTLATHTDDWESFVDDLKKKYNEQNVNQKFVVVVVDNVERTLAHYLYGKYGN